MTNFESARVSGSADEEDDVFSGLALGGDVSAMSVGADDAAAGAVPGLIAADVMLASVPEAGGDRDVPAAADDGGVLQNKLDLAPPGAVGRVAGAEPVWMPASAYFVDLALFDDENGLYREIRDPELAASTRQRHASLYFLASHYGLSMQDVMDQDPFHLLMYGRNYLGVRDSDLLSHDVLFEHQAAQAAEAPRVNLVPGNAARREAVESQRPGVALKVERVAGVDVRRLELVGTWKRQDVMRVFEMSLFLEARPFVRANVLTDIFRQVEQSEASDGADLEKLKVLQQEAWARMEQIRGVGGDRQVPVARVEYPAPLSPMLRPNQLSGPPSMGWRRKPVFGKEEFEQVPEVTGMWTPNDLSFFLRELGMLGASPEERGLLTNEVLMRSGAYFLSKEGVTSEQYLLYVDQVRDVRKRVEEMKTWGESAGSFGGMMLDGLWGIARVPIAMAADMSYREADAGLRPEENRYRIPLQTVARQGWYWSRMAMDSADRGLSWGADRGLETAFESLIKDVDHGKIPFNDPAAFKTWFKRHADAISAEQAKWYAAVQGLEAKITLNGEEQTMDEDWLQAYSQTNGLEAKHHAALLVTYIYTQDPEVLQMLRVSLKNTPQRAAVEREQQEDLESSTIVTVLTQLTGIDYTEIMKQAGNPLELASNLAPLLRGIRLAGKATSAGNAARVSSKMRAVAVGLAGDVTVEGINLMVENPEARMEDYKEAGLAYVANSLGLHVVGYTSAKAAQAVRSYREGGAAAEGPVAQQEVQRTPSPVAAADSTAVTPPAPPAIPPGTAPGFLRLANEALDPTVTHDESRATATYHEREDRDPGRALARLREGAAGERAASPGETGGAANETGPDRSGYRLPPLDAESVENGIASLERRQGQEHDVRFDPESNAVIKLTNAGEFGSGKGGLHGYLERLDLTNELFDDAIRVEGVVRLPGETADRVVTTQPWYRADENRPQPTQPEIDLYMRAKGFLRAYDGAYLHESRDIVASDALPKNFVLDSEGHVHPVDVMLARVTAAHEERLQNMVNNQRQLPAPVLPVRAVEAGTSPLVEAGAVLNQTHPDPVIRRSLAEEARQGLEAIQPGLVGKDTGFFDSPEDLLQSEYARRYPFTESQIAEMQGVEGFYDRRTGTSIVLTGNVQLRDGESPQAAVTRVVLHERVGEGGIRRLLGVNPAQAKRFKELTERIPADELSRIVGEEGYARLKDHPEDLAIEWFARKAQARPDLMKQPGLVRELWNLLKETVAEWQIRLGWSSKQGRGLDAEVESLIQRARDQAIKGRPLTAGESWQHADGTEKPRLAFSLPIRQDKPTSWAGVKPGHRWMSAKKFLPKLNDARPVANSRGAFDVLVRDLAKDLKTQSPTLKDPWGADVLVASPQAKGQFGDPFENRAAHLLGEERPKGSEIRHARQDKILWQGAIRKTIGDAQVRVRDGAETLYFRTYKEGVHMVVTADGKVVNQDFMLISQYPPDMAKHSFGAQSIVEKIR